MYLTNINSSNQMRVVLVVLFLFAGTACTENFDALNTPKDSLSEASVDGSLLGQAFAQSQFIGLYGEEFQRTQSLFSDEYAQYFTTTEANFDSGQFFEVSSWTDRAFSSFYAEAAPQLKFVEDFTVENNMPIANAVTKVWKVQIYSRWSDFFGPIMYSEFGNAEEHVPYDSQEYVYKDFFKTLDEAIQVLDDNQDAIVFGEHDQLYAGNVGQWLKYANSLRLRLALRISYVDPNLAKQEAEKAVTADLILDNKDNAELLTTPNNLNGYSEITDLSEFRMTSNWESLLKGYNDPRMSEYFDVASDGSGYSGIRPGLARVDKGTHLNFENSFIDMKWRPLSFGGGNIDIKLLRASEVYFLRAEGALRGWNMGGTVEELYNKGIRASMNEYTETSSEDIDAYIASTNTPVAPNDKWESPPVADIPVKLQTASDFETKLEQIITQKWIALFPNSWEAWAERRRTGYPVGYAIMESLNPDIPRDELVRRLKFINSERSNNSRAVEEAEELLKGPDANDTRLWWDKKPISDYPTPLD